jgi:spermidine/putrescine transport system permease protein
MSRAMLRIPRGLLVYAMLYVIFLYAPVILLPVFSFNDSVFIAFPLSGFTMKWYSAMAGDSDMRIALVNSLKVATSAAVAATVLALMSARALTRGIPGRRFFAGFSNLPLFIPDIVLGIALLILVTRLAIPLSLVTVVLGHLVICLPFALGILIARFEGFDSSLEEASRDLGENAWMTFWRVVFPLVLRASLRACCSLSLFRLMIFCSRFSSAAPTPHCRSISGVNCASPTNCPMCWRSVRRFCCSRLC